MAEKAIKFTFTATCTLQPLWFDQQWFDELVEGGLSQEQALREMIQEGFNEDWSSMFEEVLGFTRWGPDLDKSDPNADDELWTSKFMRGITSVELVDV